MAEESVLATPEIDTDNHAQLKAGAPIVISHDEVTGRYVVMCNTMPGLVDTTRSVRFYLYVYWQDWISKSGRPLLLCLQIFCYD